MASNSTVPADQPALGKPQWSSHTWMEPIIVVSIMFASMYFNRRRDFPIINNRKRSSSLLDKQYNFYNSTDVLWNGAADDDDDPEGQYAVTRRAAKKRNCCGAVVYTPNSARFAGHLHSRLLQKFPFLVEMFYWALNFVFYVCTKGIVLKLFSTSGVWEAAQGHGVHILKFEHEYWSRVFFPILETDFQHWFMNGHGSTLTFLNRAYSLVHIPGTVAFISWYYYFAPSHATFATFRRTMTLTNFLAFATFTLYPTMPPRLLPSEYGFHDTVRHDNAQSVWQTGKFANQLAAMPSLHFGYSFCIGCTLIYHSGIFQRQSQKIEGAKARIMQALFVVWGILYPALVLTVIIATANHYWLDAVAATVVVLVAFLLNRVFMVLLPLEDILLWALRLEKPIPSTGERRPEHMLLQQPALAYSDTSLA